MLVPLALTATTKSALAAALGTAVAALAAGAVRRARGTTLAAPLVWAVAAALFFSAVELTIALRGASFSALALSTARYAAAVGTFCPLMAVLGAKRPQDRGWQWIVLSLWIVLLVPAGQAWASRSGAPFELAFVWRLLIGALIALGLLNYLPTHHAFAAALVAVGQMGLLEPYLTQSDPADAAVHRLGAVTLLVIAALRVVRSTRVGVTSATSQRDASDRDSTLPALTERWLRFRNGWGAFWGLRIMNRINETASLSQWPVRLQWNGFVPIEPLPPQPPAPPLASPQSEIRTSQSEIPNPQSAIRNPQSEIPYAAHMEQTMDSLLRRFERIDASPAPTPTPSAD